MTVSLQTLLNRSNNNMAKGTHEVVRKSALELIKRAYDEGIYVQISEGHRSNARQNELYAQGRTKPGNIVTNAKAGQSWHNFGIAVDFFLVSNDGTKALWTVNNKWRRAAQIGKSLGFEWGGDWKGFVDAPHLQMTGGLSLAQLRAGRKPNLKLKFKEGDLTVSQYNKLVKRIQKLEKKVANANKNPTGTHKSGWNWLRKMGITNGKNPRGLVTRQSFATMLQRYDKERFPKGTKPSKTHKKSWDKLTDSGITNGKNPGDVVTRQALATMLNRFNKRGNKIKKK